MMLQNYLKSTALAIICSLFCLPVLAQVGIGTTNPNTHAVLHLEHGSTPRGLLLPRLSNAQRLTLGTSLGEADKGLLVTDTSSVTGGLFVWDGTDWVRLQFEGDGELWERTGNNLYPLDLNYNVGIGTATPGAKLEVSASQAGHLVRIINPAGLSGHNGLYISTQAADNATEILNVSSNGTPRLVVNGLGNVGIGLGPFTTARLSTGSSLARTLRVENTGTGTPSIGILAENSNNTNTSSGIEGRATAATGQIYGVYGSSSSADANTAGVFGTSQGGYGILGSLNTGTGTAVAGQYTGPNSGKGVSGTTSSTASGTVGVYGSATNASANQTFGVHGSTNSSNSLSAGVYGTTTNTSNAIRAENNVMSNNYALRADRGVVNTTTNITAAYIGNTSTVVAIGGLTKTGLLIESTGNWNTPGSTNTGLRVNVSGGNENYAATFNGGNVGVGTSTPDPKALLHIKSETIRPGGLLLPQMSTAIRTGPLQSGLNDSHTGLVVADTSGVNGGLYVWSGTDWGRVNFNASTWLKNNNYVRLDYASDSVGIGTSTPRAKLEVAGNLFATAIGVFRNTDTDINIGVFSSNTNEKAVLRLIHAQGSLEAPSAITSNTNLGRVEFSGYALSNFTSGATIESRAVSNWTSPTQHPANLSFATAGPGDANPVTRMTISPIGNVGIGTANPDTTLHIAGQLRYEDGNQLAGRVLTSDANGVATWQDAVAGGSGWNLAGNAGTTDGIDYIGTSDNVPLDIRVNNERVGRFVPHTTSPNVIMGHASNSINGGVYAATIGGGGEASFPNRVTANYGTIGGGRNNTAGNMAAIGGGNNNTANGQYSTIAGGQSHTAAGQNASIGGGLTNSATGIQSTISGGGLNSALANYSTIGGGASHNISSSSTYATISGGNSNTVPIGSGYATIGGGANNTATGQYATIPGGYQLVSRSYGEVVTGVFNDTTGYTGTPGSFIAADRIFTIGNGTSTVARANAMVVLKNGNIGIGTSLPSVRMHISSATAGAFRLADGTQAAGRILTSDANGVATWQAPAITDWALTGNVVTVGTHFLGSTNDAAVDIRANNLRVARFSPNATSPSIFMGHSANAISASLFGATISGGGYSSAPNRITLSGDYATIGGGLNNTASSQVATIAGGESNTASNNRSTVGGGLSNTASGDQSTVAGGGSNTASQTNATVGGGSGNMASGGRSTVGGGQANTASGTFSTIGGGQLNKAQGDNSAVSGGWSNVAAGNYSAVLGGQQNRARSMSEIAIGQYNDTTGYTGTPGTFIATDRIFTIGIGAAEVSRANALVVLKNGNIGIGTSLPSVRMHISSATAGAFRLADGTQAAGRVLTSDANGVATWQVPPITNWSLAGNAITSGDFLGTTNTLPLEFRLNNVKIGLLTYSTTSPNITWGHSSNNITMGVGSVITGGGAVSFPNVITDNYGFIGGGRNNQAGDNDASQTTAQYAVVVGGTANIASAGYSYIGGGQGNTASSIYASIGGGQNNTASGGRSTIGGGEANSASGGTATIAGGWSNTASGSLSTVAGGQLNKAEGDNSAVSGGWSNAAQGTNAFVSSGWSNVALGNHSVVLGGQQNRARSLSEVVIGQYNDTTGYTGTPGTFVATDRVFTIGTGTSNALRANAMVVLKNGNTGLGISTPTSRLHNNGSEALKVDVINNAITLNETHRVIIHTATGNQVLNLPTAASCPGRIYTIKKTSTTSMSISLAPSGGNTIEGAAATYNPGASTSRVSYSVISDGTNGWWVIDKSNN
ncbi:MAG: hypothetical protein KF690_03945 [Bacteroidetes bacterium]|nr:hypothetical protein [Bacteroidota bacterium]